MTLRLFQWYAQTSALIAARKLQHTAETYRDIGDWTHWKVWCQMAAEKRELARAWDKWASR